MEDNLATICVWFNPERCCFKLVRGYFHSNEDYKEIRSSHSCSREVKISKPVQFTIVCLLLDNSSLYLRAIQLQLTVKISDGGWFGNNLFVV